MTRGLRGITSGQFQDCVSNAEINFPTDWGRVAAVIHSMREFPGYQLSDLDTYQKMNQSIFLIADYFNHKVSGMMGMVNSI